MNIQRYFNLFLNQPLAPRVDFIFKAVICFYLLVLCVVFTGFDVGDFGNYYYGSYFLRTGSFDLNIYNPAAFNQLVAIHTTSPFFLNYTPIPPISSLIYVPFSFLPFVVAKYLWNFFTAIFFLVSIFKLTKFYKFNSGLLFLILLLFYIPIKTNFYLGQSYLLLIAFLIQGLISYEKGNKITAMLFWSWAILLKIFPAIVIVFLLRNKDLKSIVLLGLIIVSFILLSCAIISPDVWKHYGFDILPRLMAGEINDPYAVSYQSADVFFRRIFVKDSILNPHPIFNNIVFFNIVLILYKISLIFILFNIELKSEENKFKLFSFLMVGGMLLSGYGSLYGYIQLVFIFMFILQKYPFKIGLSVIIILSVVFSIPIPRDAHWPFMLEFIKLFVLLCFFIVFSISVFKYHVKSLYIISTVAIIMFGVYFIRGENPQNLGSPVDPNPLSLLAVDIKFDSGYMNIYYKTLEGIRVNRLKTSHKENELDIVSLMNNERGYCFGDTCYFLSDQNRGVGMNAVYMKIIK